MLAAGTAGGGDLTLEDLTGAGWVSESRLPHDSGSWVLRDFECWTPSILISSTLG